MKALAAVLLALLWCRQQGRGQAQEDEDDDPDAGREGYDDEEDEEEEEAGAPVGSRGSGPQCYTCQSLHKGESCEQVQSCVLPRTCKAIVSSWNAGGHRPVDSGARAPEPEVASSWMAAKTQLDPQAKSSLRCQWTVTARALSQGSALKASPRKEKPEAPGGCVVSPSFPSGPAAPLRLPGRLAGNTSIRIRDPAPHGCRSK
ncbi:hypothetical protein AB1E18_010737 [Capra hircus]